MDGPDSATDEDLDNFEALVNEHQAAVRSFIISRLDDPFEAYDLAQETFLVAFRRICEIDTTRPLRPWLFGIALNQVRNHQRKHRALPTGSSQEIEALLQAKIDSQPKREASIFESLEFCLGKLDEGRRNLLRLRYEEGRDISEITESQGGKHSTITMKLHRIREQLRLCIETENAKFSPHG